MAKYIHTYYFSTGSRRVHSNNPKPASVTTAELQKFGKLISIHTQKNEESNTDKKDKGKVEKK